MYVTLSNSLLDADVLGVVDTIHINEPTQAIISLQVQFNDDPTEGLSRPFYYIFDFVIFRVGEYEPLYYSQKSDESIQYGVLVEIELMEPGDYVLHVCTPTPT